MPPLLLTLSPPLTSLPPPPLIIVTPAPLAIIVRVVALFAESIFATCLARARRRAFVVFIVAAANILALAIAFSSPLSFALACPVSFSLAPAVAVPAARFARHASCLVLSMSCEWPVGGLAACDGPIFDLFDCSGEDRG
jgi:hypothetical protein